MRQYAHLETTKYWQAKAKAEYKEIRRIKNREAVSSFFIFMIFVVAIAAGTWAIQTNAFESVDLSNMRNSINQFFHWSLRA